MNFIRRFLSNHVLANLTFGLVITLGILAYLDMPRAKDPELSFNWVTIITIFPGAAAIDVEKRVTEPIEDALRRSVRDIKFVNSTSRDNISNILVRFQQLDQAVFDKRMIDLRREVQNTYTDELPVNVEDPVIYEISTSNAFPSAMVVVTSAGDDENLRRQTRFVKKDLERIRGVDRVDDVGVTDPELRIAFFPDRLEGLGLTPADISETIRAYFRDLSAGDLETPDGKWVVRLQGTSPDPSTLRDFPIVTAAGVVPLGTIAELTRTREEASQAVTYQGRPGTLLTVTKSPDANVLELVDRVNGYIDNRNRFKDATGVELILADDQTVSTREALTIMQTNALIGLFLVLLVTWLFLGTRIAVLTTIGIPFTLSGTFLVLNASGFTVNNTVLLAVVIVLGMIVDDAVVVVEAVYYRLQRGARALARRHRFVQGSVRPGYHLGDDHYRRVSAAGAAARHTGRVHEGHPAGSDHCPVRQPVRSLLDSAGPRAGLESQFQTTRVPGQEAGSVQLLVAPALYPGAGQLPASPGYYPGLHPADPVPGGWHGSQRPDSFQFLRV